MDIFEESLEDLARFEEEAIKLAERMDDILAGHDIGTGLLALAKLAAAGIADLPEDQKQRTTLTFIKTTLMSLAQYDPDSFKWNPSATTMILDMERNQQDTH